MNARFAALILMILPLFQGCATFQAVSPAGPEVQVMNDHWQRVQVYAVASTGRHFLGRMESGERRTFRLKDGNQRNLQFVVLSEQQSQGEYRSPVLVHADHNVRLRLSNQLRHSSMVPIP